MSCASGRTTRVTRRNRDLAGFAETLACPRRGRSRTPERITTPSALGSEQSCGSAASGRVILEEPTLRAALSRRSRMSQTPRLRSSEQPFAAFAACAQLAGAAVRDQAKIDRFPSQKGTLGRSVRLHGQQDRPKNSRFCPSAQHEVERSRFVGIAQEKSFLRPDSHGAFPYGA